MQEVKPLKYKVLPGFSEPQLTEHHDVLYAGYVKKLNEIEEKLKTAPTEEANATFSLFGELKRAEAFSTNAIYLHEAYFDNMCQKPAQKPTGEILQLINEDIGGYETFERHMKAAGAASRGWVVLAFNWLDMKLHIYSADYHTQGVWGCSPLLVLDVYEHAYFIDYKTGKKKYIDAFFNVIDWEYVNKLVQNMKIIEARKMQRK